MAALAAPAFAQEQDGSRMPMDRTNESGQQDSGSRQASPEIREMAQSMKSMADICRTMMKREMQSRPI